MNGVELQCFFQLFFEFPYIIKLPTSVWPWTPGWWRLRENPMYFQCLLLREGAWRCIDCQFWEDWIMLDGKSLRNSYGWILRHSRIRMVLSASHSLEHVPIFICRLGNGKEMNGNVAFSPNACCPLPFLLFVVKAAGKHLAFPQRRWWWWRVIGALVISWWRWGCSNQVWKPIVVNMMVPLWTQTIICELERLTSYRYDVNPHAHSTHIHIHICQIFNVHHNASSFQDEPVHRRSLMPCTVCQRGTLGRKRPLHLGWHEAFYGSKLIAFVASLAASSMLIVSGWLSNMFKSHQWSWPTVARSKYIQGPRPCYCTCSMWFSLKKWQENTKMGMCCSQPQEPACCIIFFQNQSKITHRLVEFDPSEVLSHSVTILIFLKQLLFTKCYDVVWFCRSPSLPLMNLICSYSSQDLSVSGQRATQTEQGGSSSGSWRSYKLKLFLKGILGDILHRSCPIASSSCGSIRNDQLEGKSWGWWHRREGGWKGLTFDFLKHLMNLEKDLDFVRSFAVPAWHLLHFVHEPLSPPFPGEGRFKGCF